MRQDGLNMTEYMMKSNDHIIKWINMAGGEFCVRDMSNDPEYQIVYIQKLEKLVELGYLERVGKRRGWYRLRESICEPMNYKEADDTPVDIWLPLRLSEQVQIHPGNLIIIAGSPNSGKTAFMLNIAKENDNRGWDVHYFTSEMDEGELSLRLKLFPDRTLDMWKFSAYKRQGDFADVIRFGERKLNIIDFLEVHDEFYIIARKLKEIHDRLNGAVAVVGLQKNPGSDTGLGGWRSMEVTRLALALEYGKCKITKAKNWVDPERNPNGLETTFKLVAGCQIIQRGGWLRKEEVD